MQMRVQVQLDIVCQSDNLTYFHTHFRLKLITRDSRTTAYICNCYIYSKIRQNLLKLHSSFPKLCIRFLTSFTTTIQK